MLPSVRSVGVDEMPVSGSSETEVGGAPLEVCNGTRHGVLAVSGLGLTGLGRLYLALGAVGLVAAVVLLVEKFRLLQDPSYVPSCSINPILSCGSIMVTDQAEVFGFPNPIIGIAGFAVVTTVGAGIVAGGCFARWFWLGLLAGTASGVAFVHWLAFQSLYRIGALCPYCMIVWVVAIAVFWYTLLYVAVRGFGTASYHGGGSGLWRRVAGYHGAILTAWYLALAGLITVRFWDYWSTLV